MDLYTMLGFAILIAFFAYVSLADSYGPGPCNLRRNTQSARTCARKV